MSGVDVVVVVLLLVVGGGPPTLVDGCCCCRWWVGGGMSGVGAVAVGVGVSGDASLGNNRQMTKAHEEVAAGAGKDSKPDESLKRGCANQLEPKWQLGVWVGGLFFCWRVVWGGLWLGFETSARLYRYRR